MSTIYFDMDGTIYNLYGQTDWLERITTLCDPTAYSNDDAIMYDSTIFSMTIDALVAKGYTIGVVSWLAGGASKEYKKVSRAAKKAWIKKHLPQATEVHIVQYGTPKHRIVKNKSNAILVDDNMDVRLAWPLGSTIDARQDILPVLHSLSI